MVRKFELKQTKGGKLMKQYHKYVGLDVHKERNEVAIATVSTALEWLCQLQNNEM